MISSRRTARWCYLVILSLTVAQLVVGTVGHLPQYAGKGFAYRLVAYPLLMLVLATAWWFRHRGHPWDRWPWGPFALVAAPFLIDVTGNTIGFFDTVRHWDDLNHFMNWGLLLGGIGSVMARTRIRPRWALVLAITGLGSILAIGWEIGKWWTFIRRGTELDHAYQDTLGDEFLGTAGAFVAALVVDRRRHRHPY